MKVSGVNMLTFCPPEHLSETMDPETKEEGMKYLPVNIFSENIGLEDDGGPSTLSMSSCRETLEHWAIWTNIRSL